jgi:cytosine deaminase
MSDLLLHGCRLWGRHGSADVVYSFPVPPIKRLRAAGVNVACGHDGICELWGPYGKAGRPVARAGQLV